MRHHRRVISFWYSKVFGGGAQTRQLLRPLIDWDCRELSSNEAHVILIFLKVVRRVLPCRYLIDHKFFSKVTLTNFDFTDTLECYFNGLDSFTVEIYLNIRANRFRVQRMTFTIVGQSCSRKMFQSSKMGEHNSKFVTWWHRIGKRKHMFRSKNREREHEWKSAVSYVHGRTLILIDAGD